MTLNRYLCLAVSFALPSLAAGTASAEEVASLERDPTLSPSPNPSPPAPANAAPSPSPVSDASEEPLPRGLRTLDQTLTAFGVLGYGYSGLGSAPGVGVRYQKTLVRDVSLHGAKVHDDIGFEGGVDFVHYSWHVPGFPQYDWSYNEVSVLAGVVWNFWIGDKLALYPKVELAYGFGSSSSFEGVAAPSYGGVWFQGAGGVAYKLGPIALRGEAGWRAVRLGAGYSF